MSADDLAEHLGALLAGRLAPRALVVGLAGGLDGTDRVFLARLGDVGDLLAVTGIGGGERLAGGGFAELTVDQ